MHYLASRLSHFLLGHLSGSGSQFFHLRAKFLSVLFGELLESASASASALPARSAASLTHLGHCLLSLFLGHILESFPHSAAPHSSSFGAFRSGGDLSIRLLGRFCRDFFGWFRGGAFICVGLTFVGFRSFGFSSRCDWCFDSCKPDFSNAQANSVRSKKHRDTNQHE